MKFKLLVFVLALFGLYFLYADKFTGLLSEGAQPTQVSQRFFGGISQESAVIASNKPSSKAQKVAVDILEDEENTPQLWHVKTARAEQKDKQRVEVDLALLQPTNPKGNVLRLPLFDKTINVFRTRAITRSETDFTWQGKVEDSPLSTVVLTAVNGALYGIIKLDGKNYEVEGLENGDYQITELQGLPVKFGEDVVVHHSVAQAQAINQAGSDVTTHSTVSAALAEGPVADVLMLYTADMAAEHASDLNAYLQNLVDVVNAAYFDSGVSGRLNLLKAEQISSAMEALLAESVSIYNALDSLGAEASIQALRDNYGADLVSLIRAYKGQSGCGLANFYYSIDSNNVKTLLPNSAYSVIETGKWYTSQYAYSYCSDITFAHEIGHNLGALHDRDHSSGEGFFNYSYGYDVGGEFATIMSYDSPGINYFSTPNKSYNGIPIGVAEGSADSADNVRTFNYTFSAVAGFRVSQVNMDTDKDGMPDDWENKYGLNPSSSNDKTLDNDGDGLTNLNEYQVGRNPIINEVHALSSSEQMNNSFLRQKETISLIEYMPFIIRQ